MKWRRSLNDDRKQTFGGAYRTYRGGENKPFHLVGKKISGEIISADSMQVYRGMDIGSAKIMPEEMQGIRHHLIDILEPDEEFNVVSFQKRCKDAIEEIYRRGNIPILAGGTGFYIQAVLKDVDFAANDEDTTYRKQLEDMAMEKGALHLHEMLMAVDEKAAEEIHANNVKRVIRALEFYHQTGKKISEHNEEESEKQWAYNACYFVLNDERSKIYERIDKRVDIMLENGLIDEVQALTKKGYTRDLVSMQGLGYKEIIAYLDGEISLDEAIYILKRDTRHFAKRQLTWFKREKEVIWLDKSSYSEDELLAYMCERMKEKGIIG